MSLEMSQIVLIVKTARLAIQNAVEMQRENESNERGAAAIVQEKLGEDVLTLAREILDDRVEMLGRIASTGINTEIAPIVGLKDEIEQLTEALDE